MRNRIIHAVMAVIALVALPGCLTFREQSVRFDYETGIVQMDFRDLRSIKDDKGEGDDLEKDWAELKKVLEKKDEFDPDVVEVRSKELYQEQETLSGKAVYQVKCPKCFPTKLDLLKVLFDDGRWEIFNDEIFLILSGQDVTGTSNGKTFRTDNSIVCVWPQDQNVFEFAFAAEKAAGESLLPKYLSEQKK